MTRIVHVETFGRKLAHLILEDGRTICLKVADVYTPEDARETRILDAKDPFDDKMITSIIEALSKGKRVVIE